MSRVGIIPESQHASWDRLFLIIALNDDGMLVLHLYWVDPIFYCDGKLAYSTKLYARVMLVDGKCVTDWWKVCD